MANDFEYQISYVRSRAQNLLTLQDSIESSPSFGCYHTAYWRDKTSEFPDTRFQEAGATLALLTDDKLYDATVGISKNKLFRSYEASLNAWKNQQHRDGSFDEWYKYEHGFAVTTFSLIAKSFPVLLLDSFSSSVKLEDFYSTAEKAASWLLKREDMVKTNHEMAGAAALAMAYRVFKDPRFKKGAQLKLEKALSVQEPEGWFNEVAGMDLGYCSVLLDYAMIYAWMLEDEQPLAPMKKLFRFMNPFFRPNFTIAPEAGLCLNPYVSRLGLILLSEHDELASSWVSRLFHQSPGFEGVSPILGDDLRLCRWSHLPCVAKLQLDRLRSKKVSWEEKETSDHQVWHPKSNIVASQRDNFQFSFLPAGGGVLRAMSLDTKRQIDDLGYLVRKEGKIYSCVGYSPDRRTEIKENLWKVELPFAEASFFYPSFLSRLFLRVAGAIPGMAIWLRRGIDFYRKVFKTAVNQSSAPVAAKDSVILLYRTVLLETDSVKMVDLFFEKKKGFIENSSIEPQGMEDWEISTCSYDKESQLILEPKRGYYFAKGFQKRFSLSEEVSDETSRSIEKSVFL